MHSSGERATTLLPWTFQPHLLLFERDFQSKISFIQQLGELPEEKNARGFFLLAQVPSFHVLLWVHVLPPQSFPLHKAELGVKSRPCLWFHTNGSHLAKKRGRTWWRGCPSNPYNIVIKPFGMTWMYSSLAVAKQRQGLPSLRRTLQNSFLAVAEIWVEMCGYFSIVTLVGQN